MLNAEHNDLLLNEKDTYMVCLRASEPHDMLTIGAPCIRMSNKSDKVVVRVDSKSSVSLLVPLVLILSTIMSKSPKPGSILSVTIS